MLPQQIPCERRASCVLFRNSYGVSVRVAQSKYAPAPIGQCEIGKAGPSRGQRHLPEVVAGEPQASSLVPILEAQSDLVDMTMIGHVLDERTVPYDDLGRCAGLGSMQARTLRQGIDGARGLYQSRIAQIIKLLNRLSIAEHAQGDDNGGDHDEGEDDDASTQRLHRGSPPLTNR